MLSIQFCIVLHRLLEITSPCIFGMLKIWINNDYLKNVSQDNHKVKQFHIKRSFDVKLYDMRKKKIIFIMLEFIQNFDKINFMKIFSMYRTFFSKSVHK